MLVAFAVKHVMVRMMTLACTVNGWRWPRSAVPTGSDSFRMLHDEICVSIVITASVHKTGKNESQGLFVESTVGGCIRWWVLPGAVMSAVYARIVPIRIQAEKVSIYGGDVATTVPVAQLRVSCLYHYKHNIYIVNWLWSFRPYKYDKMIWTNIMASVVVIILRVIFVESSNDNPFYGGHEATLNIRGIDTGRDGMSQKGFNTFIYIYTYMLGYIYLTCYRGSHQVLLTLSKQLVAHIPNCFMTWTSVRTQELWKTEYDGTWNEAVSIERFSATSSVLIQSIRMLSIMSEPATLASAGCVLLDLGTCVLLYWYELCGLMEARIRMLNAEYQIPPGAVNRRMRCGEMTVGEENVQYSVMIVGEENVQYSVNNHTLGYPYNPTEKHPCKEPKWNANIGVCTLDSNGLGTSVTCGWYPRVHAGDLSFETLGGEFSLSTYVLNLESSIDYLSSLMASVLHISQNVWSPYENICGEKRSFCDVTISHTNLSYYDVGSAFMLAEANIESSQLVHPNLATGVLMGTRLIKVFLDDIEDSDGHLTDCCDMMNHRSVHNFNGWMISRINGNIVFTHFNGSINGDVTVRRVLATNDHVGQLSIDFGNERPPPEPPPIVRPPPEPPPLSCRA